MILLLRVPAKSVNKAFSARAKARPLQMKTLCAACLIRPDVATAGVPQHQLIFQLDMLRLGFVAMRLLASMAIHELIEE
jgi:hypothetical protein